MSKNRIQMENKSLDVFECRMCGHCCEGRGGIVLSARDLGRLAAFLNLSEAETVSRYAEKSNGKLKIKNADNGWCVFFNHGCGVHEAKPDICRAWPFFKGNLEDRFSLEMAKEFCPGISPDVSFEEFAASGLQWLEQNGLFGSGSSQEANSLLRKTGTCRKSSG